MDNSNDDKAQANVGLSVGKPDTTTVNFAHLYAESVGNSVRRLMTPFTIARESFEAGATWAESRTTSFQSRVNAWMLTCFGAEVAADLPERNHRFLEEALELAQANGCTKSEAAQLVLYVYGRPAGEPAQEVGGVLLTLASLCTSGHIDMMGAGKAELDRCSTNKMIAKLRAKNKAKVAGSPLPSFAGQPADTVSTAERTIALTPAEIKSGLDRIRWAEGLIRQLPADHDGRNSWLLNYGRG